MLEYRWTLFHANAVRKTRKDDYAALAGRVRGGTDAGVPWKLENGKRSSKARSTFTA